MLVFTYLMIYTMIIIENKMLTNILRALVKKINI